MDKKYERFLGLVEDIINLSIKLVTDRYNLVRCAVSGINNYKITWDLQNTDSESYSYTLDISDTSALYNKYLNEYTIQSMANWICNDIKNTIKLRREN